MSSKTSIAGLQVEQVLHDLVCDEILPGTGIDNQSFWEALAQLLEQFGPANREAMRQRDDMQLRIDEWHSKNQTFDADSYAAMLTEQGYLVPEGGDFSVEVSNVDDEIANIAGAQLVVPVNNARYALNAANARWGSLYDALYGTDAISEDGGAERAGAYLSLIHI